MLQMPSSTDTFFYYTKVILAMTDDDLPRIFRRSRTHAVKFPSKIYVEVISDDVKNRPSHDFALRVS